MTSLIPFVILAVFTGIALAVQTGVNTQLRLLLGNPLLTAFISFCVGTVILGAIVAYQRTAIPLGKLGAMPWWLWLGGVFGVFIVTCNIVVAPKLGSALLISLAIAGQLLTALVLDHYGSFGFPQHDITAGRLLGAALLIGGVVLIRFF